MEIEGKETRKGSGGKLRGKGGARRRGREPRSTMAAEIK